MLNNTVVYTLRETLHDEWNPVKDVVDECFVLGGYRSHLRVLQVVIECSIIDKHSVECEWVFLEHVFAHRVVLILLYDMLWYLVDLVINVQHCVSGVWFVVHKRM